ncbi:MAG: hypothetical protein ACRDOE_11920, partial [Streptosporangiaceae bacterium]
MTATRIPDQFGNIWQYHPRSDRHSKVACWAAFFDLLTTSALLRRHVAEGKVIFGLTFLPALKDGDSFPHGSGFLFHWRLRPGCPVPSYAASAGIGRQP